MIKTSETYMGKLKSRLAELVYSNVNNPQFSLFCYVREPSKVRKMLWVFAAKIIAGQMQTPQSLEDYFSEVRAASLKLLYAEFPNRLTNFLGKPDVVIMPVLISDEEFSPQAISAAQNHKNTEWYLHELSALVQVEHDKVTAWRRAQAFQSWQLGAYGLFGEKLDAILKPTALNRPMPPGEKYEKLNFWWNLGLRESLPGSYKN